MSDVDEPLTPSGEAAPEEADPEVEPREEDESAAPDASSAGYEAVVYFHGIGEQRRYEEVSRLVDSLDGYAHEATASAAGGEAPGLLMKIRPRFEPARDDRLGDVTYLRVIRARPDGERTAHRFFEVYWAPITAGGRPAREVVLWLMGKLTTPLAMLRTPWRARARLHRAVLYRVWRRRAPEDGFEERDLATLVREYNRFERPDSRRRFGDGFGEFLKYLRGRFEKKKVKRERMIRLARRWRRSFVVGELGTLAVLLSLGLTLALGSFVLLGSVLAGLRWLGGSPLAGWLTAAGLESVAERLDPSWTNALVALALLASVAGFTRSLGGYLGDIQFWATYSETDEKHERRRRILERGSAMLSHVLTDERCRRVTVVAHSLGTAIAMECLLELGRHNRARHRENPHEGPIPLEKVRHFVTFGSPIDKLHYFFESRRTRYHRYARVFDDVRGDIGEVPFAKNRKPHVHWVNVWDRADIISGPLESPTNARTPQLEVDNVEISSLPFPLPAASHDAYFTHRQVIGILYRTIFDNACDYADAPRDARGAPDYSAVDFGPGRGRPSTKWIQLAILALPWWLVALVSLAVAGAPAWLWGPVFGVMMATGGLIGGGLALNSHSR